MSFKVTLETPAKEFSEELHKEITRHVNSISKENAKQFAKTCAQIDSAAREVAYSATELKAALKKLYPNRLPRGKRPYK